jgi:hypothetical protein
MQEVSIEQEVARVRWEKETVGMQVVRNREVARVEDRSNRL